MKDLKIGDKIHIINAGSGAWGVNNEDATVVSLNELWFEFSHGLRDNDHGFYVEIGEGSLRNPISIWKISSEATYEILLRKNPLLIDMF